MLTKRILTFTLFYRNFFLTPPISSFHSRVFPTGGIGGGVPPTSQKLAHFAQSREIPPSILPHQIFIPPLNNSFQVIAQ